MYSLLAAGPNFCPKRLKLSGHAGPSTVDPAKVNRKTVDAHKALQAALLPLGKARQQGSSPAQLRDMAAAKGLLVQDVLRVCPPACTCPQAHYCSARLRLNWLLLVLQCHCFLVINDILYQMFGNVPCQHTRLGCIVVSDVSRSWHANSFRHVKIVPSHS